MKVGLQGYQRIAQTIPIDCCQKRRLNVVSSVSTLRREEEKLC